MKFLEILLIFLCLKKFVTSQNRLLNISLYDTQLSDIHSDLSKSEIEIGNLLNNLAKIVNGSKEDFRMSDKLATFMERLVLTLNLQGTLKSYDKYQKVSNCNSVYSKITELAVNSEKYLELTCQAQRNQSELYRNGLWVVYSYLKDSNKNNQQQSMGDIILGLTNAAIKYLQYIQQLDAYLRYEKSISVNLKFFVQQNCKCSGTLNSTLLSSGIKIPSLQELEGILMSREGKVVMAANNSLALAENIENKNFENVSHDIKHTASKIVKLSQKLIKMKNYINTTSITAVKSCNDLHKVNILIQQRNYKYSAIISHITSTSSYLTFYMNLLDTAIANKTNPIKTNIDELKESVVTLKNEMTSYTAELTNQIQNSNFTSNFKSIQMFIMKFCGCKSVNDGNESTTTALLMTTTTISRTTTTTTITPTTTLDPKIPTNADVCAFTKALYDSNGTYIKSACIIEEAANGTFSNYNCQINGMRQFNVNSNLTKMAVTIFIQETLSEGTFWIAGGDGRFCSSMTVNESSFMNKTERCSWYDYQSICEYKDLNVTEKIVFPVNFDTCGLLTVVGNENPKFACLVGYTRTYDMSDYNCRINGMKMFNVDTNGTYVGLDMVTGDYFEDNSGIVIWLNGTYGNGTCTTFNGTTKPFTVGTADCGILNWSYCETPVKIVNKVSKKGSKKGRV